MLHVDLDAVLELSDVLATQRLLQLGHAVLQRLKLESISEKIRLTNFSCDVSSCSTAVDQTPAEQNS